MFVYCQQWLGIVKKEDELLIPLQAQFLGDCCVCVITETRKNSTDTTFFHVRPGITTQPQIKWPKFKHDLQDKCVFLGFGLYGMIRKQT